MFRRLRKDPVVRVGQGRYRGVGKAGRSRRVVLMGP